MRPASQEYLTPAWVRFTLTIPGQNYIDAYKAAESCKEYLKKGREVYIEGRLRIREYDAKDNGGKRQRVEIIAGRVQFLGSRPAEAEATAGVEGDLASDDVPF
jgi:single-strand DNA-binding protein